ncbi:hypothetical protein MPTK1_3g19450 [Marchantia polymorpha subsp. ruderalis]|uniref:Uncharacterized protein n=2 Tax=Marchantia polymorpha TaxID=3197 RepID=A0AAF6B2J9_MARPO|nr:hypothetical protein MARPO_0049s0089 [Marchantia polymorpha]BBN06233.1 hypothetical protein Mp_3g19450 [Marchantia polymorpha subsp. ruderalis]|eukprot:PTQ38810.1 hypothetical protein MARPO_0049s0089 [Marchantia polymorpha]
MFPVSNLLDGVFTSNLVICLVPLAGVDCIRYLYTAVYFVLDTHNTIWSIVEHSVMLRCRWIRTHFPSVPNIYPLSFTIIKTSEDTPILLLFTCYEPQVFASTISGDTNPSKVQIKYL